jgi:DNA-binding NtrC family response regulator
VSQTLASPRMEADEEPCFHGMLGQHPSMRRLFDEIQRAAVLHVPVLIQGTTGSGKELVARALHALSGRPGAFLPVNAAALPDQLAESELFGAVKGAYTGAVTDRRGLIEAAAGGTLYLDESGDIPLALQSKLLRTLEDGSFRPVGGVTDRRVRFGVVLSVQQSPTALAAEGRWRADFLYRVGGIVLRIPPLTERPSDIGLLVDHWLHQFGRRPLMPGAMSSLSTYAWPGNVRELRRAVERAVFTAGARDVTAQDILDATAALNTVDHGESLHGEVMTLQEVERRHIEAVFFRTGFNARATALQLGLSLRQFYRRLQALDISLPHRRRLAGSVVTKTSIPRCQK